LELPQGVRHAAAGEHVQATRLLERGDQEPRKTVESAVLRLVCEIRHGDGDPIGRPGRARPPRPLPCRDRCERTAEEYTDGQKAKWRVASRDPQRLRHRRWRWCGPLDATTRQIEDPGEGC